MKVRVRVARILAGPTLLVLTAGTYTVEPLGNTVLPSPTPVVPGTQVDLAPQDVVFRSPVGFLIAAVPDHDVTVNIGKTTMTFGKGVPLGAAKISSKAWASADAPQFGFCPLPPQPQICLLDTDGDRQADHAILATASKAQANPVAISPVSLNLQRNVPLPQPSFALIRYAGPRIIDGRPVFWLFIVENGRQLNFDNGYAVVSTKDLPKDVSIFGAAFTLTAYDPRTHHISLILKRDIPPSSYGVTRRTNTTFIPSFIPRR